MEDERLVAFLIAGRLISLLLAGRLCYSVAWIAHDTTATLGFRLFYDHEPVNDGHTIISRRRDVVIQYLTDAFELPKELATYATEQAHEWQAPG
jgi:diadenosine tetraphosphate (Ap4A) HIT family hydrolase